MNSIAKKFFVFLLLFVFITMFSASYKTLNLDNIAILVSMAVDRSDTNRYQVTFQFTNSSSVSETGTTEKAPSIVNTIEASSLSSAINLMNAYIGKELTLSHCKLIVFSEEVAKQGIQDEIYTLMNDSQIRPSTNIVISKCTAKAYIQNSKPILEPLITKYYEVFSNSSQYTGYTVNATIGDFFNDMLCETCEPFAILGGINSEPLQTNTTNVSQKDANVKANESPVSGSSRSENIGLAIFKNGTLVGELNAIETLSFLSTRNEVEGFLVTVPNPDVENSYIDLYLTPAKETKTKVDLVNGSPYVTVNYSFKGRIYSMKNGAKYLESDVLSAVSNYCSSYLESTFSSYLYKTSKEFGTDINGIGKKALTNFFTMPDFETYNWNENYRNCFFDVHVDTNIKSGSLLTET
jgi:spore germination protein KC